MQRRILFVGLVAAVLSLGHPASGAVYFDSDFETTFDAEGWTNGRNGGDFGQRLELSSDTALAGSRSVKATWAGSGGDGGGAQLVRSAGIPQTTHIFGRISVKFLPGWQVAANGKSKMMRWRGVGANGTSYPAVWLYNMGGANYGFSVECPYDDGGGGMFDVIGRIPIRYGSWDQVEWEMKLNDPGVANGELRLWVNGVLDLNITGRQWVGPSTGAFGGCGAPHASDYRFNEFLLFVQSGLGTAYYDRVAVGNTRIGMTTGGSIDTVPPNPPAGLQIR